MLHFTFSLLNNRDKTLFGGYKAESCLPFAIFSFAASLFLFIYLEVGYSLACF